MTQWPQQSSRVRPLMAGAVRAKAEASENVADASLLAQIADIRNNVDRNFQRWGDSVRVLVYLAKFLSPTVISAQLQRPWSLL